MSLEYHKAQAIVPFHIKILSLKNFAIECKISELVFIWKDYSNKKLLPIIPEWWYSPYYIVVIKFCKKFFLTIIYNKYLNNSSAN